MTMASKAIPINLKFSFLFDIYVGKVEKIKKDNYKITNTLYVLPDQDMNDITYVGVLKSK